MNLRDDVVVACPYCGEVNVVEDCDVFGADWGNVFCPKCTTEIPIASCTLVPIVKERPKRDKPTGAKPMADQVEMFS